METRAHHVLIGAFALVVLLAAALSMLWLGKLRVGRAWDYYDIVFNEPVTGLSVGGGVQYNGITVGEVRELKLDEHDPRRVIARVRLEGGTPVKTDTKATLGFTGLTFVAIVQLYDGTPAASRLAAKPGEEVPRIVAEESTIQRLLSSGKSIITVVDDVLQRLAIVLDDKNLKAIAATIAHVEKLSGRLAAHDADIGGAIEDLAAASKALRRSLARGDKVLARLDRLSQSSDRVVNGQLKEALSSVTALAKSATALVEQGRRSLGKLSSRELTQLGPALGELRRAARALRSLAAAVEADPQSVLRGKRQRPREHATP